jgi:hypothetical protein
MSVWRDIRLGMMLDETPDTMREKLRQLRDDDPGKYREMFRTLHPVDTRPSDALSDRQLEVNCDAMPKGIARRQDLGRETPPRGDSRSLADKLRPLETQAVLADYLASERPMRDVTQAHEAVVNVTPGIAVPAAAALTRD